MRDARIRSVTVNGRSRPHHMRTEGDVQHAEVELPADALPARVVFFCDEGTEAWAPVVEPAPGATSSGLRVLRATAEGATLRLVLEGLAGREYPLHVRTPRTLGETPGVSAARGEGGRWSLRVRFEGEGEGYVRRTVVLPLS